MSTDSGMSAVGLTTGGANLIEGNVIRNNGRFGLEIKVPNGTVVQTTDGQLAAFALQ